MKGMTVEKAIEVLELSNKHKDYWPGSDLATAIKLGIGALKLYVDLPLHRLPKSLRELLK